MTLLLIALLLFVFPQPAPSEVSAELESQWKQTILYGIDSQVLDVVTAIGDAKDGTLTPELVSLLSRTSNTDIRKAVIDLLANLNKTGAETVTRSILADWQSQKADLVASSIHYLMTVSAQGISGDLKPLVDSPDNLVSSEAISALGKTGDRSVTPFLLQKLASPDFPDARKSQLILALADMKDPASVDPLIAIVKDTGGDKTRRMYAADALGKIGDPKAIPVLKELLTENDSLSRAYAASALVRFDVSQVIEDIFSGLRDDNWRVRLECAKALARPLPAERIGDAVAILSYKARYDPVSQVRLEALTTLGTIGGDAAFSFLLDVYKNGREPADSREKALSLIAGKDLSDAIVQKIRETVDADAAAHDQKALLSEAKVLSTLKAPGLRPVFLRFLENADPYVRLDGIRGIELNGFSDLKDRLSTMAANDPLPAVREEARRVSSKL